MDKEKIKANIGNLSAEQLFDEIIKGHITLEELDATGDLGLDKKKKIRKMLAEWETHRIEQEEAKNKADEEAWERARYGNEIALRDYISNFPNGNHVEEAKYRIRFLQEERTKKEEKRVEVLEGIKKNSNQFFPGQIKEFIDNGILTKDDLIACGIPEEVIEMVNNMNQPKLKLGKTPDVIPGGYHEVYFWGIPGSGKTCALAAILSKAERLGYLTFATGPGYDYMTRLKNIFATDYAILPPPSPVDTTQYLPFTLKKDGEKYPHSISLIELSGEVFQCFYYRNADMQMPSQNHEDTFNSLQRFLGSDNRKIHFFFIDYGNKNKPDQAGYTQSDYLSAAAIYFKKNKVFKKTTDAIYVVLTKSDLMPCSEKEREAQAKEYLKKENFKSFTNALKDNCIEHSINAGRLTFEPFSLGNVYFQQICDFNGTTAENIINILLKRVPAQKGTILGFFNK